MSRPLIENHSDQRFGDALRALMKSRALTYRALAEATRELDGRGLTHAHINMLANGRDKPSLRAMELVAAACRVRPDYFAEYRLAEAMRALDPDVVGFEQAVANLDERLKASRSAGSARRVRRPGPRPEATS